MLQEIQKKKNCLICANKRLVKYLDLGQSALANSYLRREDLNKLEPKFPLRVFYCRDCHLAQLTDWVDRKMLFEYYAYFTSSSLPLHEHFKKYAEEIYQRFPNQTKQFVLDIGSNDGFFLKFFKKLGVATLGVDPAKNIAETATRAGINTWPVFFDPEVAKNIARERGRAGIITANNILAHTDNLHGIIAGVKELLDPRGVFIFEVQYLADLIKKNEFDNTYHEHISYFLLSPLAKLLSRWGLQIFDVRRVDTQGGSIRVYAGHSPLVFPISNTVAEMLIREEKDGLYNIKAYKNFDAVPKTLKKNLLKLLTDLKKQNKKIIGYGAAAKGNTLLQHCQIGPEILDYVADTTPFKQGKFTPGTHIPIYSPERIREELPDYILILAWNYAHEIIESESWLQKQGVKFIVPIPNLTII